VLDASAGPILIRKGAVIAPFTHLIGPIAIGRDSQVLGDRVTSSSIGDHCKVRGEFSNSIVLGHSNKGHAGFVGHSYLGRWVNLGAMTTTSNLKNTITASDRASCWHLPMPTLDVSRSKSVPERHASRHLHTW